MRWATAAGLFAVALICVRWAAGIWRRLVRKGVATLNEATVSRLTNKTVIVTGGSNGIGREFCRQMHNLGCTVFNLDLRSPFSNDEPNRGDADSPSNSASYVFIECDVSNRDSVHRAFAQISTSHAPHADVLFNCAGTFSGGFFADANIDEVERVIRTNLMGTIYTTHEFIGHLNRRNKNEYAHCAKNNISNTTHIINMSSCLGIGAVARMTDYCASKFGVYGFSEALRLEMKQRLDKPPIIVTTVCPALVDTELFAKVHIRYPAMMPTLSAKHLARLIIHNALVRQKAEIWCPLFVHGMPILRMLPTRLFDWIQEIMGANDAFSKC